MASAPTRAVRHPGQAVVFVVHPVEIEPADWLGKRLEPRLVERLRAAERLNAGAFGEFQLLSHWSRERRRDACECEPDQRCVRFRLQPSFETAIAGSRQFAALLKQVFAKISRFDVTAV